MFTGIVEDTGSIVSLRPSGGKIELQVDVGSELSQDVNIGASVSINGCCLTVTACEGTRLSFEVVPETLRRTSLGTGKVGDRVNVERAMRADGRLDGHIVQGHVDGTGRVEVVQQAGDDVLMQISCDSDLARLLVPKGSVAVDGVSLTVVEPGERGFSVALIPHTLARTTLGKRGVGDPVNLEVDVLGKYVQAYLERVQQ